MGHTLVARFALETIKAVLEVEAQDKCIIIHTFGRLIRNDVIFGLAPGTARPFYARLRLRVIWSTSKLFGLASASVGFLGEVPHNRLYS